MESNLFPAAIAEMEFGGLVPRLSEDLAKLVSNVHVTGRAGTLSLKLKIKPAGPRGQVEIVSDIDLKLPKPEQGKSLFFANEHGQLLRRDPRQLEMALEDDAHAPRKAKAVGE